MSPETILYGGILLSTETAHAAKMLTPGPIMSGFRIPGLAWLGPLEENETTAGASASPMTVPLNEIVAVGEVVEFM